MKQHPLRITLAAAFVVVLACAGVVLANLVHSATAGATTASARAGIVRVGAALTQGKVSTPAGPSSPAEVGLALTLACDETRQAGGAERSVDLVVVLDRSGSMAGGKMRDARDAVAELVRALGPADRFALVSYANDVTVHGSLSRVDAQTRPVLIADAMSVRAGGGTNLGGGLAAGLELLAQAHRNGQQTPNISKVILISDGHANQGVVDPLALGHMAAYGYRADAGVTTVGVGVDYNENLMGTIADHGGGNYYFLENPAMFASLFLEELSLTRAVAARNLEISIPLPPGVSVAEAGGYPLAMRGDAMVLRPGSLRSGQTRTIFLSLAVSGEAGRSYVLQNISASYRSGEETFTAALAAPLVLEAVADQALALASVDKNLWARKTVQEDYNRLREEVSRDIAGGDRAAALERIGQYEAAKRTLNAELKSEAVAENLETDLEGLRRRVEASLAPTASLETRKQASKAMQAQSYDIRRSKLK